MSAARSSRVVVLSMLVLAAVLASTLPADAAASSRSLSITASSTTPTVGSSITVSGVLSRSPKGATVTVQRLSGTRWVTARSARTTSTKGAYAAKVTVPTTAGTLRLRAVSKAIKNRKAATSRTISLDVRRKVSITATATPTRTTVGSTVTVSGTVSPSVTGTTVAIQQVSGSKVTQVASTTVLQDGTYTASLTTAKAGTSVYRAVVAGRPGYASATSAARSVVVDAAPASPAPQVTTTSLPVTSRGATYAVQLAASENGTWSIRSGSLPTGLALSTTGRITGTVKAPKGAPAVFEVVVKGATSSRSSDPAQLVIEVRDQVATTALPAAAINQPYSHQLRTHGTIAGTWKTLARAPDGLTLSPSGLLSGTPTSSGSQTLFYSFVPDDVSVQENQSPLTVDVEAAATGTSSTSVSSGSQFACRVRATDTTLWCWGWDLKGNVGTGSSSTFDVYHSTPRQVGQGGGWRSVSAGGYYSTCATRTDDSLWCWGYGQDGKLGDGSGTDANAPRRIAPERAWSTVSTGESHACAIAAVGKSLWCWGSNSGNTLGGATSTNQATIPTLVDAASWKSVSAGAGTTCATRTDDTLWCWGQSFGAVPTKVDSGTWTAVDAGYGAVCAVRTGGTLWCWGDNRSGQLGDGTRTTRSAPVQVGAERRWQSVSTAGGNAGQTTCAIAEDGGAWCWGAGEGGELGNAESTSSLVPVRVDATSSWTSVSVGDDAVCGVKRNGTQRCWGSGGQGQLGDGRRTSSALPVPVG